MKIYTNNIEILTINECLFVNGGTDNPKNDNEVKKFFAAAHEFFCWLGKHIPQTEYPGEFL